MHVRSTLTIALAISFLAMLLPSAAAAAYDVRIVHTSQGGTQNGSWSTVDGEQIFTPTASGAQLEAGELTARLGSGDVTVRTTGGGGAEYGTLRLDEGVSIGTGSTLTLSGSDVLFRYIDTTPGFPTTLVNVDGPGSLVVEAINSIDATYGHIGSASTPLASLTMSANNTELGHDVTTAGDQTYDTPVTSKDALYARSTTGSIHFNGQVRSGSNQLATLRLDAGPNGMVDIPAGFGTNKFAWIRIWGDVTSALKWGGSQVPTSNFSLATKWELTGNVTLPSPCTELTTFTTSGQYSLSLPSCSSYWGAVADVDVAAVSFLSGMTYLGAGIVPVTVRGTNSVDLDIVRGWGKLTSNGQVSIRGGDAAARLEIETPSLTQFIAPSSATFLSLTTDTPGTNRIGGELVSQTTMDFGGPTTLGTDTTLAGAGPISLDRLTGGSRSLTVIGTGARTIEELAGTFTGMGFGGIGTSLAGTAQSTGAITATAPLTLTGNTGLTSTGGAVSFAATTVNGAHAFATGSGVSTRLGKVGDTVPPTSLTSTGPTRLTDDVDVDGIATVGGALTFEAGADVTADELRVSGATNLGDGSTGTNVLAGGGELTGGVTGLGSLRKTGAGALAIGASTGTGRIVVAGGDVRALGTLVSLSEIELDGGSISGVQRLPDIRGTSGTIRPGIAGVGTLPTGDTRLGAGTTIDIGVSAGTPAALNVTGSVDLDGAALTLSGSPSSLAVGATHVIVANNGTDPVSQTFAGIAEGAIVQPAPGIRVAVSYEGGTGNDITIRRVATSTTSLLASTASSRAGEGVLLVATVTDAGATPGDVRFFSNGVLVGAATVSNGSASLLVTTLAVGVNALTARYEGDADTDPSMSTAIAHTIVARAVVPVVDPPPPPVVTPPAPELDVTAPRLLVTTASTLTIARTAHPIISLTLRCEQTEPSCEHSVQAESQQRVGRRLEWLDVGELSTTVPSGATRVAKLRLTALAKRRLLATGSLVVRLELAVADADENVNSGTRTVRIKLRGRR